MSLFERGIVESSVSFGKLLMNPKQQITGHTDFDLADYCRAIARSGFPGIMEKSAEVTQEVLDSYLRLIVDRDLPDYGATVRRPEVLRRPLGTIGRVTAAGVYCGVIQAKKSVSAIQTNTTAARGCQSGWRRNATPRPIRQQ